MVLGQNSALNASAAISQGSQCPMRRMLPRDASARLRM
jgi:hypothetical protein